MKLVSRTVLAFPLLLSMGAPVMAQDFAGGARLVQQAEHVDRNNAVEFLTVSAHRRRARHHYRRARSKKKSAVIIGGSALGGAAVGGLVGGGKGAAIGAAAGGGGGYLYDRKTNHRNSVPK